MDRLAVISTLFGFSVCLIVAIIFLATGLILQGGILLGAIIVVGSLIIVAARNAEKP